MYSTRRLAEQYGISETLVRSMAREGLLPAEQEGGRWRLDEVAADVLDDLVANGDDGEGEDLDEVEEDFED